ncbi:MAG TPA: protein kinase [Gemmatimonadaceae bacterium]
MTDSIVALNAALVGRYRIERHLGEGGMASVFLAEDVRHDRRVALKLLKPELAAVLGADRFVQEIKTTAALQHPHILPLFDSGTADGFLFYVMPYVEGETLRERLHRETQLAVGDAVRIAQDVADALDYAHRHGVIHRDVKPENILLHDGRPMVADFGIALAVSAAAGGRMTETGISLGTPHYMSPEQATADREIGPRSDIYSLGSVLYEMLAGQPPHLGGSAQQVIMKIITAPVESVTTYRKSVPANVAAALSKALEKLPADRFDTAKEFAAALGNVGFTVSTGTAGPEFAVRGVGSRAFTGVAAACGLLLVAAAWGWTRPTVLAPVIRYQLQLSSGVSDDFTAPAPVPAPDGSFIVLHGPIQGSPAREMLWMKRRDSQSATPIPGSEGAVGFTFSPNGEWIAFAADGKLKKVPIAGGVPITVVEAAVNAAFGMAWLDDGTIVYVDSRAGTARLFKVSIAGGEPRVLWRSDSAAGVLPSSIAGTHAILFERCTSVVACDLWAMDVRREQAHAVIRGVRAARYASTGDLIYVQGSRLFASRFDRRTLSVHDQAVPLADSVAASAFPIELSRSGLLVTRFGGPGTPGGDFDMVWVDRAGRVTPVDTTWQFRVTTLANNHGWALSPDGSRLAIGLFSVGGDGIWVKELPRGPLSRVSYGSAADSRPRWTSDGRSIVFISARGSGGGVYQRRADGTGNDSLLLRGIIDEAVVSRDGRWLVFRDGSGGPTSGGRDIKGVRLGVDTTRVPVIVTSFDEEAPALSPNGKWIAYQSDENGRTEVFIRSFPNTDTFKRQISTGGGAAPLWSRDGRELFYLSAGNDMMGARVGTGDSLSVSPAVTLFHVPADLLGVEYAFYTPWDVAADGRFIMARVRQYSHDVGSTVVVAENWLTELTARMKR